MSSVEVWKASSQTEQSDAKGNMLAKLLPKRMRHL